MAAVKAAHPNYQEMFDDLTAPNKSKEEITATYDKWTNYEEIAATYAPNRPKLGATAFEAHFGRNKDIKILDAGAGTGLAAVELVKIGYHNIDALEPCESLLQQALDKNIYKKSYKEYMCRDRLPIDDNVYDVIYSVGVFAPSHAREDCLEEMMRILKPGGQIMIITGEHYLKDPYMANFEPRIAHLQKEGILIRRKRDLAPNYSADESGPMNGVVLVLEKPKSSSAA